MPRLIKQEKAVEVQSGSGSVSTTQATVTTDRRALTRDVLNLAMPAIAEQLLFTVVQMAALMIVGRLGATAIAAVGVSNQLHWLFQSAFWAFGAGTTTLVARFVGAAEPLLARQAVKQAVTFSLLLSLVASMVGVVFAPAVLLFMGAEDAVLELATVYLRIAFLAIIFQSVNLCLSAALRGSGDTRTPLKVGGMGAVINVALLFLLVSGNWGLPQLGVPGAGLALLFSQITVVAIYLAIFLSRRCALRIENPWRMSVDMEMIKRLLKVGIPAALEQLLMSLGMTMFTRLVITLGTVPYATHQIVMNISSLAFMTGFGFSMAATALVGRSLGAQRPQLAEDYARTTSRMGVQVMVLFGLLFFFFGSPLVMLYSREPHIISLGAEMLKWAALTQPAMAFYSIIAGSLRGAGDTRYPLYITFVGMWTLRIGVAYLLVQNTQMGLAGVWIAVNADQWVRAVLVYLRFRTGRWKTIAV